MQALITNELIATLAPGKEPYEVRDTRLPGFLIRVQPSGRMSYVIEFGRGKRMTIGPVAAMKAAKAREEAANRKADMIRGDDPIEARRQARAHTLKTFIEEKYAAWAQAHHKHAKETLRKIESFYDELGNKKLPEITAWVVEKYRSGRLKDGTKATTTNRELDSLRAALSKAVQWGMLEKNPIANVKRTRVDDAARIRYLSDAERTRLYEALNARDVKMREARARFNEWRSERGYKLIPDYGAFVDHLRPLVITDLNTGLRRGELLALEWDDIDLLHKILTVAGATAKSGRTRHVPLNSEAHAILQAWKDHTGGSGLVFASPQGGKMGHINTAWRHLMKDAKIKNFRFHDCRHDFASQLVMAGVDLNTVRELLGHSDIRMTLRYAHLAPAVKAAAVEKIVAAR